MAGAAFVKLSLDDKALLDGLSKSQDRVKRFCAEVRQYGTQMASFSALAALPIRNAVSSFADFELKMRQVKVMTDSSADSMRKMSRLTRELGRTTSYTTSQIASGMVEFARAGFSLSEIRNSIKPAMDMAMATGSDLSKSIQVASNAIRSFNLDSSSLGRVSDVITATVNSSTQTLEDFAEAFHKASPIFNQAGYDISELSAAIGVLANLGIKGSIAGTGLSRAVQQISKSSVRKVFKEEANIDVEYGGKLRKITDIFKDMAYHMRSLSSEAEQNEFVQRTLGIIGGRTGMPMISQFERVDELLAKIRSSMGISSRSADEMERTTYGAVQRIASALDDVSIQLGELLSSSIVGDVETLARGLNSLAGSTGALGGMAQQIVRFVSAFAGLGGVIYVVSKIGDVLSVFNRPFKGASDAMAKAFGKEGDKAYRARRMELMHLAAEKQKEVDESQKSLDSESESLRVCKERLNAQRELVKSIEKEKLAARESVRESDRRIAGIQETSRRESERYSQSLIDRYRISAENRAEIFDRQNRLSESEDRLEELRRNRSAAKSSVDRYRKTPEFSRYSSALSRMARTQTDISGRMHDLDLKMQGGNATPEEKAEYKNLDRQYKAVSKSLEFARKKAMARIDFDALSTSDKEVSEIDAQIKAESQRRRSLANELKETLKKYNVDEAGFKTLTRQNRAAASGYSAQVSAERQEKSRREDEYGRVSGRLSAAKSEEKAIEKEYRTLERGVSKRKKSHDAIVEQIRTIDANLNAVMPPTGFTQAGIDEYNGLSGAIKDTGRSLKALDDEAKSISKELPSILSNIERESKTLDFAKEERDRYLSSDDVKSLKKDIYQYRKASGNVKATIGDIVKGGDAAVSADFNNAILKATENRDKRIADMMSRRDRLSSSVSSASNELLSGRNVPPSRRKVLQGIVRNGSREIADIDKAIEGVNRKYDDYVSGVKENLKSLSESIRKRYKEIRGKASTRGSAVRQAMEARRNAMEAYDAKSGRLEEIRGEKASSAFDYLKSNAELSRLLKSGKISDGAGAMIRVVNDTKGVGSYMKAVSALSGTLSQATLTELKNAAAVRMSGVEYGKASGLIKAKSLAVSFGTKALATSIQVLGQAWSMVKSYMLSMGVSFAITKALDYYNKVVNEGVERTEKLIDRYERLMEVMRGKREEAISKSAQSYNDVALIRSLGTEGLIDVGKYEKANEAVDRLRKSYSELKSELKDVETARRNADRIAKAVTAKNVSDVSAIDTESISTGMGGINAAIANVEERIRRGDSGYRKSLLDDLVKAGGIRKVTTRTRDDKSGVTFSHYIGTQQSQYAAIGVGGDSAKEARYMRSHGYSEYDESTGKWYKVKESVNYGFEKVEDMTEESLRRIVDVIGKYLSKSDLEFENGDSSKIVELSKKADDLRKALETLRRSRSGDIGVNPNRVYSDAYPGAMPDEERTRGIDAVKASIDRISSLSMTDTENTLEKFNEEAKRNIEFLDKVISDYTDRLDYYRRSYGTLRGMAMTEPDRGRRSDLIRKMMTTLDNIKFTGNELDKVILPLKDSYEGYVASYRKMMADKQSYQDYRNTRGPADDIVRAMSGKIDKELDDIDLGKMFDDIRESMRSGDYDGASRKADNLAGLLERYIAYLRKEYYQRARDLSGKGLFSNDGRMSQQEKDDAMHELNDIASKLRDATDGFAKASAEVRRISVDIADKIRGIAENAQRYGLGGMSAVGYEGQASDAKMQFVRYAEQVGAMYSKGKRPGDREYDEAAKRLLMASAAIERAGTAASDAGEFEKRIYGDAMRPFLMKDYGAVSERTLEKKITRLERSLELLGRTIDRTIRNKFGKSTVKGGAYNQGEKSEELNRARIKASEQAIELDRLYRQRDALRNADSFAKNYSFFSETSFSAKELDALGRDGTQERIARSSEGVERNTRAIDEKVRALQGRLFFNDVKATTWSE